MQLAQIDFNAIQDKAGLKNQTSLSVGDLISKALNYIFAFAGVALLIYFIMGGFQLFTSAGDQKKVAEGKATITNALVGFVIVFVAFWIVQLFGKLLGLTTLFSAQGGPF